MAAPTTWSTRKIVVFVVAVTVGSSATVMGASYLALQWLGIRMELAALILVAVFGVSSWLLNKHVVLKRIDRHFDRARQDRTEALRSIAEYRAVALRRSGEAAEAARAGDYAAMTVARGRLIAALVKWRAALPDDWPIAAQVDEMLDELWPDTDELPPDSPPDAIVAHFVRRKDNLAQTQQVAEAVQYALIVLGDAMEHVADATYDRELSLRGGFDDPAKAVTLTAAQKAFDQALDDVKFVMISKANEVADSNPKLADTLADLRAAVDENAQRGRQ